MMETNEAPDANLAPAPSAEATSSTTATTPEPANVSPSTTVPTPEAAKPSPEPFHQHPRWQEMIQEKNGYKAEADALRAKVEAFSKTQDDPMITDEVAKLVSSGVDEGLAKVIVSSNARVSARAAQEAYAPIQQRTAKQEVDSWFKGMRETHKENFTAYEGKMFDEYTNLPAHMKDLVVSDPKGLEMLYNHSVAKDIDKIRSESYQKGVDEAYAGKAAKTAMSKAPGASPATNSKLTAEKIAEMPNTKETLKYLWEHRHELAE